LQRLVHDPRRSLVDPSLVGAILRADVDTVMRDADLMGRMLGERITAVPIAALSA
jgi:hypothetical protein